MFLPKSVSEIQNHCILISQGHRPKNVHSFSQFWYGFCLRNVYFWNPDTKFMKRVASDSEVFFQRLKSYRSKTLAHGSVGIANEFIMLDNSEQVLVK